MDEKPSKRRPTTYQTRGHFFGFQVYLHSFQYAFNLTLPQVLHSDHIYLQMSLVVDISISRFMYTDDASQHDITLTIVGRTTMHADCMPCVCVNMFFTHAHIQYDVFICTETIWDEFWCRFQLFESGNQADRNSTDQSKTLGKLTAQFFGQKQTILGKACLAVPWSASHRVTSMSLGPWPLP